RVGTWLPVLIDLQNAGIDRSLQVRVGTREGAQYATEVDLPNRGRKSVTVYVYMTPASRRLIVRVLDGDQELSTQTLQLVPANQLARLVGVVVGQSGAARPPARLPNGLSLVAVPLTPADLPDNPLGLSGLNAIVLEDVRGAALSAAQQAALRDWVLRGGQLILGGGTGLAATLAGLPDDLRPVTVQSIEPLPASALFGDAVEGAEVPLARLAPVVGSAGRQPYTVPISVADGGLQAVEQSLGRGVVTALALPLGHPALSAWEGTPRLWEDLLRPALELPPGFAPDTMTMDGFIEGNMASTLTSLPALEFPPLGLLAGVLAAYIVLAGPVTYLVLRRLDRQALGWVVVPAITLIFAALTYGLGYAQRGGDIVFNQVTLLEPVDGAVDLARVRTFVGVFSPEQRAYSLEVVDATGAAVGTLVRPISLQGPWDSNSLPGLGVYMQDAAAGAEARDFEVAQWSMRAMTADSTIPLGGLAARLRLDGAMITGEVTNGSALPLRDVSLVQGDRVIRLGDLAPGATKGGELKRRQMAQPGAFGSTVPMSYLIYGEEMDGQSKTGGQPLPPAIQQRIRILDALYNYGPSTRGGQPLLLAWADTPSLAVRPAEERADWQHISVISATPRLEFAGGEVRLDQGWLAPRFEGGMSSVCFGGQGSGITLGPQPATMQLMLPRDLFGMRPRELSLLTASDGPWFDDTLIELYDWRGGAWVPQAITARRAVVESPERYLGSHGVIRVRITGPQPQANFGCIYIDARLTGVMP
ncbi:MAG: hypothetical protein HGA45_32880, partial [Chloroflexales bacterium]|nr:hypothetical protein [Chloroflexales bacterium]